MKSVSGARVIRYMLHASAILRHDITMRLLLLIYAAYWKILRYAAMHMLYYTLRRCR